MNSDTTLNINRFVDESMANNPVPHVYNRLDVDTRRSSMRQMAAIAAQRGNLEI